MKKFDTVNKGLSYKKGKVDWTGGLSFENTKTVRELREDERLKEDLKELVSFNRKEALRTWALTAQKWQDFNFLCYFLEETMELVFRGSKIFKVKLYEEDFIESYLNQDINEFISREFWECVMVNRMAQDEGIKYWEILYCSDSEYKCVIFSIHYHNPVEYLDRIAFDLREDGFKGKVLFDLLDCNGNTSNRFVEANFNGMHFDLDSFRVVSVSETIRKNSKYFYMIRPATNSVCRTENYNDL